MGSLILCYKKKAKQPYEITRIHRKIYTIEELCYYLCNNLYLIDYTIMNEQLCDWLEEELSLTELAQNLRQSLKQHGSVEQFVVTILAYASIYTTTELRRIQNVLEQLKNQKEIERKKYKADNLLESGAVKPFSRTPSRPLPQRSRSKRGTASKAGTPQKRMASSTPRSAP